MNGLRRSRGWALVVLTATILVQLIWFGSMVTAGRTSAATLTRPTLFTVVMALLLITGGRLRVPVLLARLTVAGAFLNALWHRFDDFSRFINYTATVNAFMPRDVIPFLAVSATVFEVAFCAALLLGLATRGAALGSAVLLFLFATAMTISGQDQFEWAVYVLSAGAWVVAAAESPYLLSLDQLLPGGRSRRIARG